MFVRFIQKLMHRIVANFEAMTGVANEAMHFVVDASPGAFVSFMLFQRLAHHRQAVPATLLSIARIVATRSADCGSCVQAQVNLALKIGARREWIVAALEDKPAALPGDVRDVYEFARQVVEHTYEEGPLRDTLRARYGDRGVVDLALAIATAQVVPMTKRTLGYAMSCARVQVAVPPGDDIAARAVTTQLELA
jgi:alkylhydroperoxidase family enzyme